MTNFMTKTKSRWITRYESEFNAKINLKPKSVWFVQHVLSDSSNDIEEGEILSDGRIERDNTTVNSYEGAEKTIETHQGIPVCDKVDKVIKDKGFFGSSTCDDRNRVKNSLNVSDGLVGINTVMAEVNGQFGNFRGSCDTAKNGFQFRYENSIPSNGYFYKRNSPGERSDFRKAKEFNDCGKYRRRFNGDNFRVVHHRHNSLDRKPNFTNRSSDIFSKYDGHNSPKADSSKYNRWDSSHYSAKRDYPMIQRR